MNDRGFGKPVNASVTGYYYYQQVNVGPDVEFSREDGIPGFSVQYFMCKLLAQLKNRIFQELVGGRAARCSLGPVVSWIKGT